MEQFTFRNLEIFWVFYDISFDFGLLVTKNKAMVIILWTKRLID